MRKPGSSFLVAVGFAIGAVMPWAPWTPAETLEKSPRPENGWSRVDEVRPDDGRRYITYRSIPSSLDDSYWDPRVGEPPIPFEQEQADHPDLLWMRTLVEPIVAGIDGGIPRAASLRGWVRSQFEVGPPKADAFWNPKAILEAAWRGERFYCDEYSATLVSATTAIGLSSRMLHLRREDDAQHYVAEIWSEQDRAWVVEDALYDISWLVAGHPASALDLHRALTEGRLDEVEIVPGTANPDPLPAKAELLGYYAVFRVVMTNAFFSGEAARLAADVNPVYFLAPFEPADSVDEASTLAAWSRGIRVAGIAVGAICLVIAAGASLARRKRRA